MDWGMKNRLSRLIQPDGHCFFMPIDHGYFQGPTTKLEKPWETIKPLLSYFDALFVTRGVLRSAIPSAIDKPIINASAVGLSVFIGSEYEKQTLSNLSNLVNECNRYDLPVMAVTAVGREMEKRDARYLGLCCRICAELGASVVKTYWCEDFDKVTNGCPVPVVMAGGPKVDTDREVFDFIYDGMQKGAIGLNLGRNVWQNNHPVAMAAALNAIIHEDASPKEAEEIFVAAQVM